MFRLNNCDTTWWRVRKLDLQNASTSWGNDFFALQTINALFNTVGHCSFRSFGTKAINNRLKTIDLFGLQRSLLNHAFFIFGTRTSILAIRAFVFNDMTRRILGVAI